MLKIKCLVQPMTAIAIAISIGNLSLPLRANPTLQNDRQTPIAPSPAVNNTQKIPTPSAPSPASDNTKKLPIDTSKNVITVTTVSGTAEIKFAEYLAANDIKFYGAFWCPHCQEQKSLFGAVAASKILYIECDKNGGDSQRQLCKDINIQTFPTWVINGKYFTGSKNLKELAEITGYKGSTKFKHKKKLS